MHQSDCFREFLEELLFVELVVCVCTILGHCLKSLLASLTLDWRRYLIHAPLHHAV